MSTEWTVRIEKKPLDLAVGVYPYELAPQPVVVSLEIAGQAVAHPDTLSDCLDYEPLCRWLHYDWPKSPHVPLLETRINQVFDFVFKSDPRVTSVRVGLYKKRMALGAHAVGVERRLSRAEFEQGWPMAVLPNDRRETEAVCTP